MTQIQDGPMRCPACGIPLRTPYCPTCGAPSPKAQKGFKPYAGFACEQNGGHRVVVPYWPPRKHPSQSGDASLAVQCDKCQTHLILYETSLTDLAGVVEIIVPGHKAEPAGKGGRG